MTTSATQIIALFCDFENIALGVKDAKYDGFQIQKLIERFLLKGNIVVKKAYCDWARYREYKSVMHEASFELIEIPHLRQSGKNSADIRLVVDALDLCYTKQHVDTFVIISGDSDFSPLVSKLRENNKRVVGVGVKNSTSDLLISNCDEFVFYDDIVRRKAAKQTSSSAKSSNAKKSKKAVKADESTKPDEKVDKKEAWVLIAETYEALLQDRGEGDKIWGSMVKETLKRRKPGFTESYYGYRSFGDLVEDAGKNGHIGFTRDDKSGGYIITRGKKDK